jgi:ribosomal protein L37AE/L43A
MMEQTEPMRWIALSDGGFVESAVGRITVVLLFAILTAVTMALVFLVNHLVWPVVLKFTLIAATGLFTGMVARKVLSDHTRLLQFLAAALGLLLALGLVNPVTRGFIGINMLRVYPNFPEWDGALQSAVGLAFVWLGVQAEPRVRPAPIPEAVKPRRARRAARPHPLPPPAPRRARANRRTRPSRRPRPAPRLSTTPSPASQKRRGWLAGLWPRPRVRANNGAPRRFLRRRGPAVQLDGRIEHRCPFCLELVEKRDPRGVKVCPECKTHHHADCWDVTGMCQVPHQHH